MSNGSSKSDKLCHEHYPKVELVRNGSAALGEVCARRPTLQIVFHVSSFPQVPEWYDAETKSNTMPEGLIKILEDKLRKTGLGESLKPDFSRRWRERDRARERGWGYGSQVEDDPTQEFGVELELASVKSKLVRGGFAVAEAPEPGPGGASLELSSTSSPRVPQEICADAEPADEKHNQVLGASQKGARALEWCRRGGLAGLVLLGWCWGGLGKFLSLSSSSSFCGQKKPDESGNLYSARMEGTARSVERESWGAAAVDDRHHHDDGNNSDSHNRSDHHVDNDKAEDPRILVRSNEPKQAKSQGSKVPEGSGLRVYKPAPVACAVQQNVVLVQQLGVVWDPYVVGWVAGWIPQIRLRPF